MIYVMDCYFIVSEFELQLLYYVNFWTNTHIKGMNHLSPTSNRLN